MRRRPPGPAARTARRGRGQAPRNAAAEEVGVHGAGRLCEVDDAGQIGEMRVAGEEIGAAFHRRGVDDRVGHSERMSRRVVRRPRSPNRVSNVQDQPLIRERERGVGLRPWTAPGSARASIRIGRSSARSTRRSAEAQARSLYRAPCPDSHSIHADVSTTRINSGRFDHDIPRSPRRARCPTSSSRLGTGTSLTPSPVGMKANFCPGRHFFRSRNSFGIEELIFRIQCHDAHGDFTFPDRRPLSQKLTHCANSFNPARISAAVAASAPRAAKPLATAAAACGRA